MLHNSHSVKGRVNVGMSLWSPREISADDWKTLERQSDSDARSDSATNCQGVRYSPFSSETSETFEEEEEG